MMVALALGSPAAAATEDPGSAGIPNRQVADMLFELALANRKVYTRDVVQRLSSEDRVIAASEHYIDQQGLPLPAQMFRLSAEELLGNTDDFWLQLRALEPINFANGPVTPTWRAWMRASHATTTIPSRREEISNLAT